MGMYMYLYISIHIHLYTYMYVYAYMYIHICMRTTQDPLRAVLSLRPVVLPAPEALREEAKPDRLAATKVLRPHNSSLPLTEDFNKLVYGPRATHAGFPSSVGLGVGGQSYSNFLASAVIINASNPPMIKIPFKRAYTLGLDFLLRALGCSRFGGKGLKVLRGQDTPFKGLGSPKYPKSRT